MPWSDFGLQLWLQVGYLYCVLDQKVEISDSYNFFFPYW